MKKRKGGGKRLYLAIMVLILAIVALISFCLLFTSDTQVDEKPALVIGLTIGAIVSMGMVPCWDVFRLPSMVSMICLFFAFFSFIGGRISYLGYYFTGDILGTGLSPWFVVGAVCYILSLVFAIWIFVMHERKATIIIEEADN